MSSTGNPFDPDLQRLFSEYRSACPDLDPSPNFMPLLWRKIDARRDSSVPFIRRLTLGFASLATAASLAILLLTVFSPVDNGSSTTSYVEALAKGHAPDGYILQDIAYFEAPAEDLRSEPRK